MGRKRESSGMAGFVNGRVFVSSDGKDPPKAMVEDA